MMAEGELFSTVRELLENYFQGLYHGDLELLEKVFHPLAHYTVLREGVLVHYDMPTYFDVVKKRPSPYSLNEKCAYEIVSIDFADDNTVLAKMTSSMLGYQFTDFLNLLRVDGEWRIIAKVFSAIPRETTESS